MPPETESVNKLEVKCIPNWLTKQYMEKNLCIYQNDKSLKVQNMHVTPATSKGENYASIMYRVRLEYTTNITPAAITTGSFILKSSFVGKKSSMEIFNKYGVVKCEMKFYEEITTKLNAMFREIGDDDDKMFADVIAVDYENLVIIFEDLTCKSFVMADRTNGLNIEHAKLSLKKIAKMHAATAALNEREPGIFKEFDHGLYNRHTKGFQSIFGANLLECAEATKGLGPDFQQYAQKLTNLYPHLMERGSLMFDPEPHHFNAFVHGDFWTNNIMFSYDKNSKEPIDLVMMDFQFSVWSSPALDLHYFFNTSLEESLRLERLEELLQFYYENLLAGLVAFRYQGKIPSLHEFWIQYLEKNFYAFTSALLTQPIMLNEETTDADMDSLVGSDDRAKRYRKLIYQNKKVQKNLRNLLPIFERQGLLDIDY